MRMCSFTAISGPAAGSRIRCGVAVRMSLSPRYAPGVVDRHHLQVLGERVRDLAVARDDLPLQLAQVDQRLVRIDFPSPALREASLFMPATSSGRVSATTKSAPLSRNACTGAGRAGPRPGRAPGGCSRPVRSGFCSEPDSANSFSTILLGQHEPRVLVARARRSRRACRACRSRGTPGRGSGGHARRTTATTGRAGSGCRAAPRSGSSCARPRGSATSGRGSPAGRPRSRRSRASARRRARARRRSCASERGRGARASSARTRSWLAPMPPLVTITACAASSNVADLDPRARRAPRGGRRPPAPRRGRRSPRRR